MQRDWQVDAGIEPRRRSGGAGRPRARGARSAGGVRRVRLSAGQRRGGRGRDARPDSRDLPDRDRAADVDAADRVLAEGMTRRRRRAGARRARVRRRRRGGLRACSANGSRPTTCRPRRSSHADGTVRSAVNDPNDYAGPGTGYRLEGERWEHLQALPHAIDARLVGAAPRAPQSSASRNSPMPSSATTRRGRDRRRAGLRRARCPRRSAASRTATCSRRSRRRPRRRCRAAARARPARVATSPSSATTARACPAPAWPSASSRRARR